MPKLTVDQMQAAYFARTLDQDPYLADLPSYLRPVSWAKETGSNPMGACVDYEQGRQVLEVYTLSVSFRYWRGCEPSPDHWPDAAGTIVVPSGHIAGNEAVRVAIFRPRA